MGKNIISIQLVSPASGDLLSLSPGLALAQISIQLVSPASGDYEVVRTCRPVYRGDFHSISFPSEWGQVHDILITKVGRNFHSISFPSEWGHLGGDYKRRGDSRISIQLVSPASGDEGTVLAVHLPPTNFHSISFPSEWGPKLLKREQ